MAILVLTLGVFGNLGLTLYLHRSAETAAIISADVKDNELINRVTQMQSMMAQLQANVAKSLNEVEKLKKENDVMKAALAGRSPLTPSTPKDFGGKVK